jgi:hypothetical protein
MQRLRPPDWLAGIAGVALLVSLIDAGLHVWLALTGVLAIGIVVVTATRDAPALPIAFDVLTTWAALVSIPIAIFRVAKEQEWGTILGAVATAAVFAGAWWAMRHQAQPGLKPPPEPRVMPAPPA